MTPANQIEAFDLFLVVFLGGLLAWLPRLAHAELFFAVTVPADFSESGRGQAIRRGYQNSVLAAAGAAAIVVLAGTAVGRTAAAGGQLWALPAALVVEIGGAMAAFLRARRSVIPHGVEPSSVRIARLEPRHIRLPGGWSVQLGPLATLAAVAYRLNSQWQRIPPRFPVHWGIDGQANGWASHTAAGVYGPVALGAFWCSILLLLSWASLRHTRRVHATGSAAEAELARERRYLLILLFAEYFIAVISSWAALLPLRPDPAAPPSLAPPLGLGAVLLVATLLAVGVHRPRVPATPGAPVGDATADRYWKAGIFYVNPNDPALFVEKRFGIGYTMNLGRASAWAIIAGLILLAFGASWVARPR